MISGAGLDIPVLIDVLCPTFNHENYIGECITSILAQEGVHVRLHIFDDCSEDGTSKVIESYRSKNPTQILVYTNPMNQGDGIESILYNNPILEGEYWTYIEGDDFVIGSMRFLNQVKVLSNDLTLVGTSIATEIWFIQEDRKEVIRPTVPKWNYLDLVENFTRHKMYTHISGVMWRKTGTHATKVFPRLYVENPQVRSEVALIHLILRDSKLALNFIDVIGSCYRYTGTGIWSSLTAAEQTDLNLQLSQNLRTIQPWQIKFTRRFPSLRVSKLIKKTLGYGQINP